MSLIDDVVGKKLPTGRKFQAKVGAGNARDKLYGATRSGALKNLSDNQDIINQIASDRQADIRAGTYGKDKINADMAKAIKSGNLSADDQRDLQAILEHWSKGPKLADKGPQKTELSDASKRRAEAKKQFKPAPVRELPEFLKNRGKTSINQNPWTGHSDLGGSGGGIASGTNANKGFRKPTLLN